MAQVDKIYHNLCQHILDNGKTKKDRTGNGTISVFAQQLRFDVSDSNFPLITTKKMYTKGIVYELFWFLGYHMKDEKYKKFGLTNIKWLVDNNVNIWVGDAYKKYKTNWLKENPPFGAPYENQVITEEEFIEKIKTDDDFTIIWGELGPVYGKQWIGWNSEYGGINQIEQILQQLTSDPDSRRIMVNAWNVGELHNMTLPPCHYGFQFYTRDLSIDERVNFINNTDDDKIIIAYFENPGNEWLKEQVESIVNKNGIPEKAISLMWNQRSVDTFLGLPFNIASYALLLYMIAGEVNMVPEELICSLGDTHIYNGHIDSVKEQLERDVNKYESAKIIINRGSKSFFELTPEDIEIKEYKSYKSIKTELYN